MARDLSERRGGPDAAEQGVLCARQPAVLITRSSGAARTPCSSSPYPRGRWPARLKVFAACLPLSPGWGGAVRLEEVAAGCNGRVSRIAPSMAQRCNALRYCTLREPAPRAEQAKRRAGNDGLGRSAPRTYRLAAQPNDHACAKIASTVVFGLVCVSVESCVHMVLRYRAPAAAAVNRVLVGDCLEELGKLPGRKRRSRLCRSALQSAARARPAAPEQYAWSTASTTTGTSSPASPTTTRFSRAWLRECRRILKPDGAHLGDRLLPQHLPPRRGAAGPGLLDPERRRLAQDQPDAELPRQALHQRARDADLGGARAEVARTPSTTKP